MAWARWLRHRLDTLPHARATVPMARRGRVVGSGGGVPRAPVIRVLHIITGLDVGGAEMTLARVCAGLSRDAFDLHALCLTGDGPIGDALRAQQVDVTSLSMRGARDLPRGLRGIARKLRDFAPHVVQTWLCHADLLGGVVTRVCAATPVIWGVHHADYDPATTPLTTRLVLRLCAWLAPLVPARVVSCSATARDARVASGFPSRLFELIPNGVDLAQFRPDPFARAELRAALGVPHDALLVGLPARWHADKDHALFAETAALLLARHPQLRFVLAGGGIDAGNQALVALLRARACAHACHLLGLRRDMPRVLAALDVGLLTSRTEAFPNVVTETMACAVPMVATAVGDIPRIVGDTGVVVPAGNAQALAVALDALLSRAAAERAALGAAARARVAQHFDLRSTVAHYAALYRAVSARSTTRVAH